MPQTEDLDGLWLFDGVCNFCFGSVRIILALDHRGELRFTPLQSPYGRFLAQQAGLDPQEPTSFLFFDRGQPLQASDAVIALLRRLPAPWRWLALVEIVPRMWRDAAYGVLARNRYRLLGKRRACMIPSPDVRARFVTEIP